MSERSGVEIDYCPQCRGVWLDRGELDKIIDRAAEGFGAAAPSRPAAPPAGEQTPPGHIPPPLYNPPLHTPPPYSGDPRRDDRRPDDRRYDERRDRPRYEEPRYDDRRRAKKKEGWLGELFDF